MRVLPGLTVCAGIALLAELFDRLTSWPAIPAALALAILLAPLVSRQSLQEGFDLSGTTILRLGIVLLGAQLTVGEIVGIGPLAIVVISLTTLMSLGLGMAIGRRLKLDYSTSLLGSVGVAICGASAILAVSATLKNSRNRQNEIAVIIAIVTIVGSIAMLAYPEIAEALSLNPTSAGLFFGTSLHEMVHAVGAGLIFGSGTEEISTTAKLLRILWLAPILYFFIQRSGHSSNHVQFRYPIPSFLVGFLIMAGISSTGKVPTELLYFLREVAHFCFLMAIAGIGLRMDIRNSLFSSSKILIQISIVSLFSLFCSIIFVYVFNIH